LPGSFHPLKLHIQSLNQQEVSFSLPAVCFSVLAFIREPS
jgi:hypothetical protein